MRTKNLYLFIANVNNNALNLLFLYEQKLFLKNYYLSFINVFIYFFFFKVFVINKYLLLKINFYLFGNFKLLENMLIANIY